MADSKSFGALGIGLIAAGAGILAYPYLFDDGTVKTYGDGSFSLTSDGAYIKMLKRQDAAEELTKLLNLPAGSIHKEDLCAITNGFLACQAVEKVDPELYHQMIASFENKDVAGLARCMRKAEIALSKETKRYFVAMDYNYTYKDMAKMMGKLADTTEEMAKQSSAPPSITYADNGIKSRTPQRLREGVHAAKIDTRGHPPGRS